MIIPVRCFTCGKVIADKWEYYKEQVEKAEKAEKAEVDKKATKDSKDKRFDKLKTGKILDDLGLSNKETHMMFRELPMIIDHYMQRLLDGKPIRKRVHIPKGDGSQANDG